MDQNIEPSEQIFFETKLPLSKATKEKLVHFLAIVLETNQSLNLTAITDFNEGLVKHLYDSLAICAFPEFDSAISIIDIGSGGGFPVVPLAIAFPEKNLHSLDSTQKKVNFQKHSAETLQLANFIGIWGRAEELGHDSRYRETFDIVTARAVSQINVLLEITVPFAKVGGFLVFYKGPDYQSEINNASNAERHLGVALERVIPYTLPQQFGQRCLVVYKKIAATSAKYPRKPGIPQKKPL